MASKHRKRSAKGAQPPQDILVDASGNPLPPQFEKHPVTFEGLPDDINLMIFRYLLICDRPIEPGKDITQRIVNQSRVNPNGSIKERVALLRVSKSSHHVAAQVFYGTNHFLFRQVSSFTRFTKQIKTYRRLVQHLILRQGPLPGPRVPINVSRVRELQQYRALKSIVLLFGCWDSPYWMQPSDEPMQFDTGQKAVEAAHTSLSDKPLGQLFSEFRDLEMRAYFRYFQTAPWSQMNHVARGFVQSRGTTQADFRVVYDHSQAKAVLSLVKDGPIPDNAERRYDPGMMRS